MPEIVGSAPSGRERILDYSVSSGLLTLWIHGRGSPNGYQITVPATRFLERVRQLVGAAPLRG